MIEWWKYTFVPKILPNLQLSYIFLYYHITIYFKITSKTTHNPSRLITNVNNHRTTTTTNYYYKHPKESTRSIYLITQLYLRKQAIIVPGWSYPSIGNSNNFPRIRINPRSFPPCWADLQGRLFPTPIVTQSCTTYSAIEKRVANRTCQCGSQSPVSPLPSPSLDLNEIHGIAVDIGVDKWPCTGTVESLNKRYSWQITGPRYAGYTPRGLGEVVAVVANKQSPLCKWNTAKKRGRPRRGDGSPC